MAAPSDTPPCPPATLAAKWGTQALGAAILLATAWPAAVLLAGLPRHYGATSFWFAVGIKLPVWIPCWAGGLTLLRGRPSGFLPLYAAAALLVAGEMVIFVPSLDGVLGPPRYGGVCRSWPVVLALLVLPVVAHLLSVRLLPPEPAGSGRRWCRRVGLLVALWALYLGCSFGRPGVEQEAGEVVRRGNTAYQEGRRQEGLAEWGRAIDGYPHTSAWGVAVFNTGVWLQEQHRYPEAIARFEGLLGSDVDDRDPTGYLMEACQNYQHDACLQISVCHEALGDYPSALRYAVLARDRYPYQSWCGTCSMEAGRVLRERVERLERCCR